MKSGFRVYYRARAGVGKDGNNNETTCIAESKDGIHWKRPQLSLFKVDGVTTNNVVLKNAPPFTHNFSPFRDNRPDVSRHEKYKSLYWLHPEGLALFVSADGLKWKLKKKQIITSKSFAFDSQACTFWSPSEK